MPAQHSQTMYLCIITVHSCAERGLDSLVLARPALSKHAPPALCKSARYNFIHSHSFDLDILWQSANPTAYFIFENKASKPLRLLNCHDESEKICTAYCPDCSLKKFSIHKLNYSQKLGGNHIPNVDRVRIKFCAETLLVLLLDLGLLFLLDFLRGTICGQLVARGQVSMLVSAIGMHSFQMMKQSKAVCAMQKKVCVCI